MRLLLALPLLPTASTAGARLLNLECGSASCRSRLRWRQPPQLALRH